MSIYIFNEGEAPMPLLFFANGVIDTKKVV